MAPKREIGNCPYSLLFAVLLLAPLGAAEQAQQATPRQRAELLAPDGVPYDNEGSFDVMQMKALSTNLVANGSFEQGRYWPYGWQATDGLTTFWIEGGTDGRRCLRIYTDVLEAQWKARSDEVRAAVLRAAERAGGDAQSLPDDPVPPPPERIPTQPPYYDTVAGLHGVHYRSDYVPCVPGAAYRFSIDARAEADGEPKVFVKGFFDQQMQTRDGVRTVRQEAYRAPISLDPCDGQWRRYARLFHPSQSQTTLAGRPVRTEWLQVQIYAYWRPGSYHFDNVRLEIVGREEPGPSEEPAAPEKTDREEAPGPALGEDEFPVFDP
ncbi:MAG: hypothetical protein AMK73_03310 [Planctomycetes bacterium SM23_32]|nr:MAG: hypothetical protein AMK73_03310 [Planctomycetes bacterium SM23_32]